MTTLSPAAAYRAWAPTYDLELNPLLALETRILSEQLPLSPGVRVLDLATGTGRWLQHSLSRATECFGLDLSAEMLAKAARKPALAGRLVRGTIYEIPFPDDFADLAICSFALGYFADLDAAFCEMARVARTIVVTDLHPDALRHGWIRSFRADGEKYEIENHRHSQTHIGDCGTAAGLTLSWSLEASFEEPEREIFIQAGKDDAFEAARQIPAIFISSWERP